MTDDLVKRLRDWSEYDEGKINDAREEAADRIEQLEAALLAVVNWQNGVGGLAWFEVAEHARAALAGEK